MIWKLKFGAKFYTTREAVVAVVLSKSRASEDGVATVSEFAKRRHLLIGSDAHSSWWRHGKTQYQGW